MSGVLRAESELATSQIGPVWNLGDWRLYYYYPTKSCNNILILPLGVKFDTDFKSALVLLMLAMRTSSFSCTIP